MCQGLCEKIDAIPNPMIGWKLSIKSQKLIRNGDSTRESEQSLGCSCLNLPGVVRQDLCYSNFIGHSKVIYKNTETYTE